MLPSKNKRCQVKSRFFRVASIVTAVIAIVTLVGFVPSQAQAPAASAARTADAAKSWTPPRTADGQPDIQGFYARNGIQGLAANAPDNPIDPGEKNPLSVSNRPDGLGPYPRVFGEGAVRGAPPAQRRALGIVDPPNKILPWRPGEDEKRREFLSKMNPAADLQHVELNSRCALPGLFVSYNPYQILQRPGSMVILSEYNHYTRVIHLDGRPHLGKNIRLFMGDSIGHWEGNTLVVDTTNFNKTAYSREIPYLSDALHTIERFTPVDAKTIDYEITVDDPKLFTKAWKSLVISPGPKKERRSWSSPAPKAVKRL